MNIVFMGTPQFSVPTLQRLIDSTHQVAAVFCQPDRAKGRSHKPVACPVKETAQAHGIPVFQPERIRKRPGPQIVIDLKPDVIVVAAFGHILSQKILDTPPSGCVNVHASLLPRWRGASPIHHALLAGDTHTGVSIMRMVRELDAGPIYMQERTAIPPSESRPHLEDRLASLGADLLMRTLDQLDRLQPVAQDSELATFAPMITKQMGHCDFSMSAAHICNMVRAFEDWPGVRCGFRGHILRLLQVRDVACPHAAKTGEIIRCVKGELVVATGHNSGLSLLKVQPAGKKAMDIGAFINGFQPTLGEEFHAL